MSRGPDIDIDADLFWPDEDADHDDVGLLDSADVRTLHSSARRFVVVKAPRAFRPAPVKPTRNKGAKPRAPRPRREDITRVDPRLPFATFPAFQPHYKLLRPKKMKLPSLQEPSDYELRRAEPVAMPRELRPLPPPRPERHDFPWFKISDKPDAVDAPKLGELIDVCLSVLGYESHRTLSDNSPVAWLLNLRRAVRYHHRKTFPKAVRNWAVPPFICPTKPELAAAWREIREEITEAADALERGIQIYGRAHHLNAYSTFMMVAIVGAARILLGHPDGPAQYRIGVRMMPKELDWWISEHRFIRQRHRHYTFNDELTAVLRRVGVTEAQIADAQRARLFNRDGARLIVLDTMSSDAPTTERKPTKTALATPERKPTTTKRKTP